MTRMEKKKGKKKTRVSFAIIFLDAWVLKKKESSVFSGAGGGGGGGVL